MAKTGEVHAFSYSCNMFHRFHPTFSSLYVYYYSSRPLVVSMYITAASAKNGDAVFQNRGGQ
jgi:hypothetical protein